MSKPSTGIIPATIKVCGHDRYKIRKTEPKSYKT
jgi:hypothetical protein